MLLCVMQGINLADWQGNTIHRHDARSLARSQKQTDYLVLAGQCALAEQRVNMNSSLTFVLMKNCLFFLQLVSDSPTELSVL